MTLWHPPKVTFEELDKSQQFYVKDRIKELEKRVKFFKKNTIAHYILALLFSLLVVANLTIVIINLSLLAFFSSFICSYMCIESIKSYKSNKISISEREDELHEFIRTYAPHNVLIISAKKALR